MRDFYFSVQLMKTRVYGQLMSEEIGKATHKPDLRHQGSTKKIHRAIEHPSGRWEKPGWRDATHIPMA